MKKINLLVALAGIALLAVTAVRPAVSVFAKTETSTELIADARSAMLLDYDTGTVVYQKNELERRPIASMVKIMTLLIAFEEADSGRLDYDAEITVSQNASSMGGSQAFLDAGSSYKTTDLLQSIVVASANDSCVAIAETIAGSVDAFVGRMNEKAKSLGMENTMFVNCTGLPADGQYSCAADVAKMSRELFSHKKFFEYSGIWMYDLVHPSGRQTRLTNTNKLIRAYEGCDGGKTGFTNEAMSCLSATAKRGNTRLISIVIGAADGKKRNAEICKLFNYGFANYESRQVVKEGDTAADGVKVKGGKTDNVCGVYASSLYAFGKKGNGGEFTVECETKDLRAPVIKGDVIGKATVIKDGNVVGCVDILADSDVGKKGYMDVVDEFIDKW